jgi:hypothetical protein
MECVTFFIDTNGFIQLRDLKDIPWRQLFPGVKIVRIVVARVVIEELDRHKTSTKDRARNRARAALKLISEASKAPGRVLVLKEKPARVTLEIAPRAKLDWDWLAALDPSKPDDRLVAEAITFGNDAAIFSHDSGPRLTADDIGLRSFEPLEDWHLPDEKSDLERKLAATERQLERALSTRPKLSIEIEGRDKSGRLTVYQPIVPPLDSQAVDRLVKRYLAEYPRRNPKGVNPIFAMGYGHELTVDQVSGYHGDYDDFEGRVRSFFQRLHEQLTYLAVPIVPVRITNTGSVSAVNYHVTMEAAGDFTLVAEPNDIREMCPFPKPPKVPRPRLALDPYIGPSFLSEMRKEEHPTEMLWIKRPKVGARSGRYGCRDFQPDRIDQLEVTLWPDEPLPVTGTVLITVGANDVPDITETVEVTIEERTEGWDSPLVIESLPEFLSVELKALKMNPGTYEAIEKLGKKVRKSVRKIQPKG